MYNTGNNSVCQFQTPWTKKTEGKKNLSLSLSLYIYIYIFIYLFIYLLWESTAETAMQYYEELISIYLINLFGCWN